MVELAGYLHPRDVLTLLRERDGGRYPSPGALGEPPAPHDVGLDNVTFTQELESSSVAADGMSAGPQSDPAGAANRPEEGEDTQKKANVHEFDLTFVNEEEGPVCMKGIFYYKIGTQDTLAHEPIKAIPFGHLLLNS
ncbi:unnamed protein product [Phytomonas sp. Hart1]|nr:unnamed protein product [Phytomonas sp. Hart1]|eukprot:CCW69464.1 unnamed protein product [Phytomonas sp. isolate Hart1]